MALLSIDEISNVKFRKSTFGGYKPEEVDLFIDNVHSSYCSLCKQKSELEAKIDSLNKELSKYREEEECIRNAIISAQKLADASIIDANNKAREIVKNASDQANDIIEHARSISEEERNKSQKLHDEVKNFRDSLVTIYNDHIKLINQIPDNDSFEEALDDNIRDFSNKDQEILEIEATQEIESTLELDEDKIKVDSECEQISKEIFSNLQPDDINLNSDDFGSDYDKNSSVYKNSYSSLFKL